MTRQHRSGELTQIAHEGFTVLNNGCQVIRCLDVLDQIKSCGCIVRTAIRVRNGFPRKFDIVRCERLTVRPFQALAQFPRYGFLVFRDRRQFCRETWRIFAFFIWSRQADDARIRNLIDDCCVCQITIESCRFFGDDQDNCPASSCSRWSGWRNSGTSAEYKSQHYEQCEQL
jgi:hypothetical protein